MTTIRLSQSAAAWLLTAIVVLAVAVCDRVHAQAQAGQGNAGRPLAGARLLADAGAVNADVNPQEEPTIIRRRAIAFDAAGLQAIRTGDNLTLNLFDNVLLPAEVERSWQSHVETFHWQGHVPGNPQRTVNIVLHKGVVWASIAAHDVGRYRIRSHRNLGQVVEEIDESRFAPCGCGEEQHIGAIAPAARANPAGNGEGDLFQPGARFSPDEGGIAGPVNCSGEVIDVLVVYTPEARDLEGGTAAIEALAFGLEQTTNSAYLNSAILQNINIVHVAETDYQESGSFNTELSRLRDVDDKHMDEVHGLRDKFGADLVALLISHTQGGTICGIGYLMTTVSTDFAQWGFSVSNTNCVQGGFTFEHELGHNMGCHHDHDNSGPAGAFTWSHGHRFTAKNDGVLYRTIMAYAPGSRIPYFSNPDVEYQGTPTGVPIGTPGTEANNTATLNATASTVAAFRPTAGGSIAGAPATWPPAGQLLASDPHPGDRFGNAVAVSGDFAIVGAYTDDENATDAGAAYVFRFDSATNSWQQEQKLMAPDGGMNDHFGGSVDILSLPGSNTAVAVVGAYSEDNLGGQDAGSVYLFRRNGSGTWVFEQKLTALDGFAGDSLGRSVAIAQANGSEIVVAGAPMNDDHGNASGSAYVFRNSGSGWVQEQKLLALDASAFDQFGQSVDVGVSPADGSQWVIVGAWRDDSPLDDGGSAYLFRRDATWIQQAQLVGSDAGSQDQGGFDVAIAFADATRLAYVGAWKHNARASNTGAVYVFADTGSGWTQEIKLVDEEAEAEDQFGIAVDAWEDAVIIGAWLDDEGAIDSGSASIYRRTGTGWVREIKLVAPTPPAEAENDQMGFVVAIDGLRALAGTWQHDAGGSDAGAVMISSGTGGGGVLDCNQNGIHDTCDILDGTSLDKNSNGTPDECEPPPPTCPADVAPAGGNGFVDVDDLIAVILAWGACPAPCPPDIDTSGAVDVNDLIAVILAWGACP